jgi:hypothetical protein
LVLGALASLFAWLAASPLAAEPIPAPAWPTRVDDKNSVWREQGVGNLPLPRFTRAGEGPTSQLRAEAMPGVAGTLSYTFPMPMRLAQLGWSWRVEHAMLQADPTTRAGDDYAARVYVAFAVPLASLSFADRARIRVARALFGEAIPTAALCYVWDPRRPVGTIAPSPYTDRVRVVVVSSGPGLAGTWQSIRRDVAVDFRAAFGFEAPAVTAIAVGLDTDQTQVANTAWWQGLYWTAQP